MQVSIQVAIESNGDKFDFLMPGHVKNWISSLADQPLIFEVEQLEEDFNVKIVASSGDCEFVAFNPIDFPTIKTDNGTELTCQFEDITEALYRTSYTKLADSTGNILNFLSLENGLFVAYNGAAFSLFKSSVALNGLLPENIIQVLSGLTLIGECIIKYSDKNICFTIGDTEIKSVLGDGKYIEYKHGIVIPKNHVTVNRNEMIAAIKRVLMFSDQLSKGIKLQFGDDLIITGVDSKLKNKAEETVKCGASLEMAIGLNGIFAIEALNHIPTETVCISYSHFTKPVFIREDEIYESFALIAPIVLPQNV